jgi:hypothetical protein
VGRPAAPGDRFRRLKPWVAALSGPALVVTGALVVMRTYALQARIDSGDMTTYWLPVHCFMGRSLRSGHIPGWNPYAMSGLPFAPDPQAGWLSLPPMAFFTALPCGTALRWLMIALVLGAGIALYWFLRGEGVSRMVATVGGVVLSIGLASSQMPPNMRFSAAILWTLLLLGATGRFLRAARPSSRVLWLIAAALCWGQLAAAYLGLGLLVGTLALLAYLVAVAGRELRSGRWTVRRTAGLLAPVVPVFLLVNLAYFLPRLAYSSRVSLSLGYGTLAEVSERLLGQAEPFPGPGTGPGWPLNFSLVPGRYLGGVVVLSFAAFWSHRRHLVWAFSLVGVACYLGSLQVVVDHVPKALWSWNLIDQYLHRPHRLVFGLFVPMAVLSALGVEAWLRAESLRARVVMLVPGVLVWVLLPLTLGAPPPRLGFVALGAAVTVCLLLAGGRTPAVALAIPPILALELVASTVFAAGDLTFGPASNLLDPLRSPRTNVSVLTPTKIARAIAREGGGRYLTIGARRDRLALHTMNQGMLYGIESTGGYLSVQLERYWLFVRNMSDTPMDRQYALFERPPPVVLDLLQVKWLVAHLSRGIVEPGAIEVARDGPWALYRRAATVPRATALFAWETVGSKEDALRRVVSGLDPARIAVLEEEPGIGTLDSSSDLTGTATYVSLGPQAARVEVDLPAPAIIVIRNVYDPNWRATVDGRPVRLMAADYVVQGVAVPAGAHTIELGYDDPTVGLGLLGSGLALAGLGGSAWFLRRRDTPLNPPVSETADTGS